MKKFIMKLMVFIVIVTLITMGVNYLYIKQNNADPHYIKKFTDIPDTIQICNFGSSHGLCGYNYENYEEKYNCFNFGLASQTLSYDYRLFQNYSSHFDKGTVVFITVSYFSLFGKAEKFGESFESKNMRYYSILPRKLIKEYDLKTDLFVRYVPALGVSTRDLIGTLVGKSYNNNDANWQKVASDINIEEDAEKAYTRHIEINKYDEFGKRIVNREELDALYDLIKDCQAKGAIPVLITTPYLYEYTDEVNENTEDFYEQFYSIINKVVSDTNVEYYDYAFDERFINEYSYFRNSDHLNKNGASIFTDIIMQEIVYENGYY